MVIGYFGYLLGQRGWGRKGGITSTTFQGSRESHCSARYHSYLLKASKEAAHWKQAQPISWAAAFTTTKRPIRSTRARSSLKAQRKYLTDRATYTLPMDRSSQATSWMGLPMVWGSSSCKMAATMKAHSTTTLSMGKESTWKEAPFSKANLRTVFCMERGFSVVLEPSLRDPSLMVTKLKEL